MGLYIALILIDTFVWWNLLTDLRHRSRIALSAVVTIKAVITVILLALILSIETYRGEFADPRNINKYLIFGTVSALIISIGSWYILASLVTRIFNRIMHRRLSGVVWTNITIAGLLVILISDSYFRQRFDVRVVSEEIVVADLDPRLEGLKIVLISDLHLSSFEGHYNVLREMTGIINSLEPDILVNGGDFISYGWQEFGECDTILKNAHARYGAFAIVGNHDDGSYYPGFDAEYSRETEDMINRKVEESGYTLLRDTSKVIVHNGAKIRVAGIVTHGHHLSMRYGNIRRLAAPCDTIDFNLLLAHDPAAWNEALLLPGTPELTLSGHTHGMQVGFPVPGGYISPSSLIHPSWKGHYEKNGCSLFVSTGMGSMGMASRIFMPPEIVLITLKKK